MLFDFPRGLLLLKAGTGRLTEDEATGNPLTFNTNIAKPFRSLLVPFTPKQSGTGDPSPENVRPITGWNGVKVEHFDSNLLAINRSAAQETQGITYTPIKQDNKTVAVKVEGTRTSNNPFFNLNHVNGSTVSIAPGTYKIFGGSPEVRIQVFYKDSGGTEQVAGQDTGEGATATIPADAMASWCRLLVVVNTPVDTVIYPVVMSADSSVAVYPVTWSESGEIYGGYVDLVTGEVWQTWVETTVSEINSLSKKADNIFECFLSDRKYGTGVFSVKSDTYKTITNVSSTGSTIEALYQTYGDGIYINSGSRTFYIGDSGYTDAQTFKTDRADVQIVYELATPVLLATLTPSQIAALVGNNTIWSDANGENTVVYLKKA